jgi:hypothetical protein
VSPSTWSVAFGTITAIWKFGSAAVTPLPWTRDSVSSPNEAPAPLHPALVAAPMNDVVRTTLLRVAPVTEL